jgi:UDP-N-acetylglucosamine--dolichyl-phosphate N-acetylglucosaminephosphotransferase
MAFAVVGILGHFSKTLLLFFIPQIFNFLYSTPQLFGIVPCPRHRLPRFNEKTGLLEPSWAVLPPVKRSKLQQVILRILAAVRLVQVRSDPVTGQIEAVTNLTILNLILVTVGPIREDRLTMSLMGLQGAGSLLAFGVRYGVSGLFYDTATRR